MTNSHGHYILWFVLILLIELIMVSLLRSKDLNNIKTVEEGFFMGSVYLELTVVEQE